MHISKSSVTLALLLLAVACASKSPPQSGAPTTAASEFLVHFDAQAGELPEGLFVTSEAAYVGFAPTSQVARVDLASHAVTNFGQLPAPAPGKGFMTGIVQAATGEVFAGLASFVPEVQAGIYRIPKTGGASTLFAKDDALPFPNGLAFDNSGALWATDSGSGSVFRFDAAGHAERWLTADVLTGKKDACGAGLGPGFDIGANGIVVDQDAVYVVNTDKATLIRIPRDATGHAGEPTVIAGPNCDGLGGADGLTRAPDGSFVVAINRQNKVVRVKNSGALETIAVGTPLDFPASVSYGGSALYVTNFAFANASAGKPALPGLLKLGVE